MLSIFMYPSMYPSDITGMRNKITSWKQKYLNANVDFSNNISNALKNLYVKLIKTTVDYFKRLLFVNLTTVEMHTSYNNLSPKRFCGLTVDGKKST